MTDDPKRRRQISTRADPELVEAVERAAAAEGRTVSNYVLRVLTRAVEQQGAAECG